MGRKGKNKSAAAATKPKGKPGPKGKFQGFRLEYLESVFPTYLDHVRKGTTTSYWAVVEAGYWARFNWRCSDLRAEADEDMFRNASVVPDKDGELTSEEEEEKGKMMLTTNKVCDLLAKNLIDGSPTDS
jgi:hypothetical protein